MAAGSAVRTHALAARAAVVVLSLAFVTWGGCSKSACSESRKTVTISGMVRDDGFVSGDILVTLAEDESERCTPGDVYSTGTPGDTIEQSVLAAPGAYSVSGEVRWVVHPPDLDLMVSSRGSDGVCRAGAFRTLSAQSASDIEMVLIEGDCPRRL